VGGPVQLFAKEVSEESDQSLGYIMWKIAIFATDQPPVKLFCLHAS
jgi:hypothetical protein